MVERSKSVEVSARSVEEAISQALQQLGLPREDVEIEVIKHGSRGLLGLLSEESVVRVTTKSPLRVSSSLVTEAEDEQEHEDLDEREAEEVEEISARKEAAEVARDISLVLPAGEEDMPQLCAGVLQQLLDDMGVLGHVVAEPSPLNSQTESAAILLNIVGDDLGLLIGRRGETLRDLQFLTCLIVSRRTQHWPSLVVDVEHYKLRREKSLVDLAKRMADKVRTTSEPISLEPMPAYERRIVHLALRDDLDVRTESTGQDEKRKVVIYPKD